MFPVACVVLETQRPSTKLHAITPIILGIGAMRTSSVRGPPPCLYGPEPFIEHGAGVAPPMFFLTTTTRERARPPSGLSQQRMAVAVEAFVKNAGSVPV
jgi:hypothetical protein